MERWNTWTVDDRLRVATVATVCVVLIGLALIGEAQAKKKQTLTVTGAVQAAEMRRGKITAVFIHDADQGEFFVLRGTDVAKQLVKQVGVRIRATGYVGAALREEAFDTYIDILEYEILPEPPPTH